MQYRHFRKLFKTGRKSVCFYLHLICGWCFFWQKFHLDGGKHDFVFIKLLKDIIRKSTLLRKSNTILHKLYMKWIYNSCRGDYHNLNLILKVRNSNVHQFKYRSIVTTQKPNEQLCGYYFQLVNENIFLMGLSWTLDISLKVLILNATS